MTKWVFKEKHNNLDNTQSKTSCLMKTSKLEDPYRFQFLLVACKSEPREIHLLKNMLVLSCIFRNISAINKGSKVQHAGNHGNAQQMSNIILKTIPKHYYAILNE